MSLRHSEVASERLTADEARAFLQLHAEREAAPTTTTVADLSESLHLPEAEVRAMLEEARSRLAAESARRERRRRFRFAASLAGGAALVVVLLQLLGSRQTAPLGPPPAPPVQEAVATDVAPATAKP